MELKRRNSLVYGLLGMVWLLVTGWQVADHVRVKHLAREELIQGAKDVSTSVSTTVRAFRRFGNVVSKGRLESALNDLLIPGKWEGIALLNEARDIVAGAGNISSLDPKGPPEVWGDRTVVLINLVALGTNVTQDLEATNPPVIIDFRRPSETNRPPFGIGSDPGERGPMPPPGEGPPDDHGPRLDRGPVDREAASTNAFRERGGGRTRFPRPPWLNDEEWKAMTEKQGVHGFAIVMATQKFYETISRDLWLRSVIVFLAAISVVGLGLAWKTFARSSELQLRLVRASEMNTHLKEMNLAAAGLAHETRNPLNIIRGMAQMISKQPEPAPDIRDRARAIVDETDKVTAQLNEFINYSRPREVRRTVISLHNVLNEVARALSYDIDEKKIRLEIIGDPIAIEADDQMLRQVLFNLVLNAIQALGEGGEIQIATAKQGASEAILEIRDNGPGVEPQRRKEIFKPYFTTQQKGTGLGLAIVQQIVLAHGWEIECLANEPKGAIFRITHLKLAAKG